MLANTVLSRTSQPVEVASRVEDEWCEGIFFHETVAFFEVSRMRVLPADTV